MTDSLVCMRLTAALVLSCVAVAPVMADEGKLACPGYKLDILKIVKPGQVIRIKSGAVACRTPTAYDEFVAAINARNSARAAELESAQACVTGPKERATVKVLQIRPSAAPGSCNMQFVLHPDRGSGQAWTDVGMFDEVVVSP